MKTLTDLQMMVRTYLRVGSILDQGIYCVFSGVYKVDLQEGMEDMGLDEEEEEGMAVRNDAMTIFRGHSGMHAGLRVYRVESHSGQLNLSLYYMYMCFPC